ncbi:MAG: aminotransferase class I/II-fold pyridoxal phosphate-dependent enzyme [Alphaproteobacteria bacterium]|nr:aminotransferase class I/II-fold pyridoxal phosphate-dependent enzyme [Alphaproteobacteria bacterium]
MNEQRLAAARRAAERSNIASFMVMDVMAAAARREKAGHPVVHLEVGQPGTSAPRAARDAAKRAIDSGSLGYTLALGMPALRERIAVHYAETYGISVAPERIVITSGSSAGFVLAFLALFDAGDRVALPSPGYPCYRNILNALGQDYATIETSSVTRWMPTVEQLISAGDVRGLLLASPNNPTGTMIEPERLEAIARHCDNTGKWLISDEIYHGLTYDQPATTALSYSNDAVIIHSFSKYFSMTGWRVGWMVVPETLLPTFEKLAQNLYICAPAISQAAALGAFDGKEELEANVEVYRANRELLLSGLPAVGLSDLVPADGAFYLYADVGAYTNDSLAFSRAMLDETGVAATSGFDFDETRGSRYMRFSYAGSTTDIHDALERLAKWQRLRG